jgi:hypothetical protein
MQYAIPEQPGRHTKETICSGVLIEAEAGNGCIIIGGCNEHPVEAIDMVAITTYIQIVIKGITDKGRSLAGYAEAAGRVTGSSGLFYYFGHATQEVFSIALISDKITEFTGKRDERILKCHQLIF